jgi:hypothetical protein
LPGSRAGADKTQNLRSELSKRAKLRSTSLSDQDYLVGLPTDESEK